MDTLRSHRVWINYLTGSWLIATFEHNYFTLHSYTHNLVIGGIPISGITALLMVLALDLSIFWSVMFIPTARKFDISIRGAQMILVVSTIISILLNVRYMITSSPSNSMFDMGVAIVVGILIPLFVVIFGWIEGNIMITNKDSYAINGSYSEKSQSKQDGIEITKKDVDTYFKKNPRASIRDAAKHFGLETYEIGKIMEDK